MTGNSIARFPSHLLGMSFLAAALAAGGAQLDNIADEALGKPTLATVPGCAASAACIANPAGIAEDPVTGVLWVADETANRVLRFSSAGAFVTGEAANLVLGQADFVSVHPNRLDAAAANTLFYPGGVAVDQAGRLYVADQGNSRVLVYHPPFANGMDATSVVGQGATMIPVS